MTNSSDKSPAGLRLWLSALLDLLYPPHCVACGRLGAWLCAECVETIPVLESPKGRRRSRPEGQTGPHSARQGDPSLLAGTRSVAAHTPPLLQAIHALKYEGLRALAAPLADILTQHWQRTPLPVDVIVPVPLHRNRRRQRGYNQAALLARAFSRRICLPLDERSLIRERNTRSQVGLSWQQRRANVWGAFRCRSDDLRGSSVLLFDDVLTTGATLEACASALLEAGVEQVWAVTLTRAVHS